VKAANEKDREFVARIVVYADKLAGHYGWTEHQACLTQVPHGRLNRVFEVADIKYLARPVPEPPAAGGGSKKRKVEAAAETESVPKKKTGSKKRKQVSRNSEKTSVVEKVLE
jgi:hypothetical protein